MTHLDELATAMVRENLRAAAAILESEGWAKSTRAEREWGGVTVAHALARASRMGSEVYVSREILRRRGFGEPWWMSPDRFEDDVIEMLRTVAPSVDDFVALGGPRWRSAVFVMLIEQAIPRDVVDEMDEARGPKWTPACETARRIALQAGLAARMGDSTSSPSDWCAFRGAAWAKALTPYLGRGLDHTEFVTLMHPLRRYGVHAFMETLYREIDAKAAGPAPGIATWTLHMCQVEAREFGISLPEVEAVNVANSVMGGDDD
ncbi:hypothetical protein [Gordonia sp. ABSL49_1]|uniref:hypothetical protein n=1 Tax=Gordonia sp. ABSL49_1 TaxID=2920941 RepID=UPI001F0F5FA3|nr:hypothetical protein [Gordonia sp. ABSL49_1]MCH5644250.1 hypothetical protein [Gordonia sp. ABSL49_1]